MDSVWSEITNPTPGPEGTAASAGSSVAYSASAAPAQAPRVLPVNSHRPQSGVGESAVTAVWTMRAHLSVSPPGVELAVSFLLSFV